MNEQETIIAIEQTQSKKRKADLYRHLKKLKRIKEKYGDYYYERYIENNNRK